MREAPRYPGGVQRAKAHIDSAIESHFRRFGEPPRGMWPAEGGVSHPALMLLAEKNLTWAATGEGVLANSLQHAYGVLLPERQHYLYKPYRVTDGANEIVTFFRDDKLSDKIGFEYSKWHGPDAVNDFVRELEHIWHITNPDETPVVSIILDGENARILSRLQRLFLPVRPVSGTGRSSSYRDDYLQRRVRHCSNVAGRGTAELESFHGANIAWRICPVCRRKLVLRHVQHSIGSPDKNRGWNLLCEAKKNHDPPCS